MRFALSLSLAVAPAIAALAAGCATVPVDPPGPHGQQVMSNDCAVIAAIAKEHYKFGPDNPPPPLKASGDDNWRPDCNFESLGFTFSAYTAPPPGSDPRTTLKWVAFQKPVYDGQGARVATEIMHGPLAGIGYECRLHSGIAGWTVGACKTGWIS